MIGTIFTVSIVIFLMVRLLPGNIIDIMFGGDATATPEAKAAAAKQLGIDGSYPHQYWKWISGMFQGDLGRSLLSQRPIAQIFQPPRYHLIQILSGHPASFKHLANVLKRP